MSVWTYYGFLKYTLYLKEKGEFYEMMLECPETAL